MSLRALYCVAAFALVAPLAPGQFQFYSTAPNRWAAPDNIVGTSGFTEENFENAPLHSWVQVRWYTDAGDSGPFSTLPNVFNPSTDPFGNAFVGSAWHGTMSLVNTKDNQSHPYTSAESFGDVEFLFSPPMAAVGFSLQQANLDIRVVINGVDRGGLASLVPLTFDGGRQGYVVIESTGSERITSLRLNNTAGDGWTIDALNFIREPRFHVQVTGFPDWGLPDAALGIAGLSIEDFEDTALVPGPPGVPGLELGVTTALGSYSPTPTLPNTFDPASDTFGDAFDASAWDGPHSFLNTRDNQSHIYAQAGNWGDVLITNGDVDHLSGVVGFSVQGMDLPAAVIVNGRNIGSLPGVAGLPLSGRNGYVRLHAADSLIYSIYILNGRTTSNDGFALDHLAFGPVCRGDVDGDRAVNTVDLTLLLASFGSSAASVADIDGSGFVDTNDLVLLLAGFGHPCP